MNITVLAGGWSPERDVSLTSGSLIANALMARGHRVLLLDPYLGVDLPEGTNVRALFRSEGEYHHAVREDIPDLSVLRRATGNGDALIGRNVPVLCRAADVVYNALHGDMGENGTLQGFLDCYGIRYTGTGAIGAMLSMDKDLSKRLLRAAGVATPDWIVLYPATEPDVRERILREIGLPCVIKPCSCGSSVGVSIVEDEAALDEALRFGTAYEGKLIAEKKITGRELTMGFLGDRALPPIEIRPLSGFYDYKNKYQGGQTMELCPAPITDAQTERLGQITRRAMRALELECYARFDYIMDAQGEMWCLEANALPGMTPTSLLPQMAAAVGMDYGALCDAIVDMAMKKPKKN